MARRFFRRSMESGIALMALLLFSVPFFCASQGFAAAPSGKPAAKGWHAKISGHEASPRHLVAVAKKDQTLFLFEHQSPLRMAAKYICTTGQNEGDKFTEGDLKTPEGIYFVIRKLNQGLNFEKYGYEAYTLNYPNPVDKLRKKTGYGIWIHGRGVPITPYLTEGCVSLNNADLAVLAKNLTPGTPVALAHNVSFTAKAPAADKSLIDGLNRRTFDWAKAWASRSKKLFDFYDPDAYTIAQGESFSAFRAQKERVFKNVSYIDIKLRNVQTLEGPGYWVTWFQQDYKASNLSSKGVRRLYWQKDKKGVMRIVAMEWFPQLSGTLTAGINEAPAISATAVAVKEPAKPATATSVAAAKPAVQPTAAPTPVANAAPAAAKPAEPVAVASTEPKKPVTPEKKPVKAPDVTAFIEAWRKAWEKGDLAAYTACYDDKAVQGSRAGASAIRAHKRVLWKKSSPKQVVLTNMRITSKQDIVTADMHQSYTDSNSFADMGVKTLRLILKNNQWRIVREDWSPM